MTTTVRNVLIILLLAAAVAFVPGGGTTGAVVGQIVSLVFLIAIAFAAYKVYREQRLTIYGLGDRNRALLYGAIGLAVLAIAGTNKLWNTGSGTAVWFAMVAAAAFAVFTVYRASREY